jgi:Tol biopolymer transport system component
MLIGPMLRLVAVAVAIGDIAVFSAGGEPRVSVLKPPTGNRFLVDPCWASPTTLFTLNEGPPSLLQRREGTAEPVTVRRVSRMVDASLAPGCDAMAMLREGSRGYDVWLQSGRRPARRVLRTRTYWESRPRFSWTPDARRVAISPRAYRTRLRIFDVASGRMIRSFALRRRGVDDLGAQAFSPDGRHVVYSEGSPSFSVRVADVRTGEVRLLRRSARAAAFSRSGDRVAVMTRRGLRVLDLAGRTMATVSEVGGEHLAWSPDDTRIAVTGPSNSASVDLVDLTATPPHVERRLNPSHHFASSVVWSPNGSQLAIERDPF